MREFGSIPKPLLDALKKDLDACGVIQAPIQITENRKIDDAYHIYSQEEALAKLLEHDDAITNASREFGIKKELLQGTLYREMRAASVDDIRPFGSVGLGQVKAETAQTAEKSWCKGKETEPQLSGHPRQDAMWLHRNDEDNIRYSAMVFWHQREIAKKHILDKAKKDPEAFMTVENNANQKSFGVTNAGGARELIILSSLAEKAAGGETPETRKLHRDLDLLKEAMKESHNNIVASENRIDHLQQNPGFLGVTAWFQEQKEQKNLAAEQKTMAELKEKEAGFNDKTLDHFTKSTLPLIERMTPAQQDELLDRMALIGYVSGGRLRSEGAEPKGNMAFSLGEAFKGFNTKVEEHRQEEKRQKALQEQHRDIPAEPGNPPVGDLHRGPTPITKAAREMEFYFQVYDECDRAREAIIAQDPQRQNPCMGPV